MKLVKAALATALTAGLLVGAPVAFAAEPCDYKFTRSYSPQGVTWYVSDAGTINNSTSAATVKRSISYTVTGTASTTVSGEVAVKATAAVAEISAKFAVAVTLSASVSRTETFEITVPPYKKVSYRSGIAKRKFRVTETTVYSNCNTRTKGGYVDAVEQLTEVKG
jgi:hypothetical protein